LHCSRYAATLLSVFARKPIKRRRSEWRRGYHDPTNTQMDSNKHGFIF
jgi:hypothetical protein